MPSRLVLGADGNLYGTAQEGGSFNQGTVFRLTFSAPPTPPRIVVPPASQTIGLAAPATFWALASGEDPLGFHWQRNGANLTNGANVSGANSSSWRITNVFPARKPVTW